MEQLYHGVGTDAWEALRTVHFINRIGTVSINV